VRETHRSIDPPGPCAYLPEATAAIERRILLEVDPEEWEAMLSRGWRRFGPMVFRPACAPCAECVSLRVPVSGFRPTGQQRRAAKGLRRFRAEHGPVEFGPDKLELYRRWHASREERRGWEPSPMDPDDYFVQFAWPHPCARELRLYEGDRLVLVGFYDRTPRALSAIYCFYEPEAARHSPGVMNVMWLMEHARTEGLEHVYLGYRVQGCPSSVYKAGYGPHELLEGRPAPSASPSWSPSSRS
jgi:arginine-tRNA-protein transferase